MNKIAFIIMIVGVVFTLVSFVQYRVLYPDMDKMFAYCGLGILTIAVGILFDSNIKRKEEIKALKGQLDYVEDKVQDLLKGGK